METEKDKRQLQTACIFEVVGMTIDNMHTFINSAMNELEEIMTEAELANDKRYSSLCGLYDKLNEVKELLTPKEDTK